MVMRGLECFECFEFLSGDMMTGFVQAAVVGAGVEGAHITSNVYRIIDA